MDVPGCSTALGRAEAIALTVAAVHAADVDQRARFPAEAFAALAAGRLLGMMVPAELGGEGASVAEVTAVCSILGRSCGATGLIFAMHQIQVASLICAGRDSPWHRRLIGRIADEQLLLASATTEAGVGGDIRSSTCAVVSDGSRLKVEKHGTVISYGRHADGVLLTARRSPEAPASDQVLVALLAGDCRLDETAAWDPLGMRGTCSNSFRLTAEAGVEQICPMPFSQIAAQSMLATSHIFWSGVWYGIAADALARAQAFVRARARQDPASRPPGASRLAEASANLQQMRSGILDAIDRLAHAQAKPGGTDTAAFAIAMNNLKVTCSQLSHAIVHGAMLICGIAGYRNEGPTSLTRHLRDVVSAQVMISNDRIEMNVAALLLFSRHDARLLGED